MLNVIALVFGAVLIAGVAVLVGMSDMGAGMVEASVELQKSTPGYWRNAHRIETSYQVRTSGLPSPAPNWTAAMLQSASKPKRAPKPVARAEPPRRTSPEPAPPPEAVPPPFDGGPGYEDFELHLEEEDANAIAETEERLADFWSGSPSPLGRVTAINR